MSETLTRVVHETVSVGPTQTEPDLRTRALLSLIESLERIGPFYSGEIRLPSVRRGLENIFVVKFGLNPFVAEQKAKLWISGTEETTTPKDPKDRPLMFVFERGGIP